MKTAKAYVATVVLVCPKCGGACAGKGGSQQAEWPVKQQTIQCCDCGEELRPPKRLTCDE